MIAVKDQNSCKGADTVAILVSVARRQLLLLIESHSDHIVSLHGSSQIYTKQDKILLYQFISHRCNFHIFWA